MVAGGAAATVLTPDGWMAIAKRPSTELEGRQAQAQLRRFALPRADSGSIFLKLVEGNARL